MVSVALSPEPDQCARASAFWRCIASVKLGIDADAAGAQRILRQVEREAVGVVELEGGLAIQLSPLPSVLVASSSSVRPRSSVLRKRVSSSFSVSEDQRLGAHQFGIGAAHLRSASAAASTSADLGAEQLGMAHGAAHDAAQHIAAAFVRRQHAVGDQEGGGAQMVGDDAVAGAFARPRP
jgi:hypothetical protein